MRGPDEALATEAQVWAIAAPESGLIGVIGLGEEFGYWLRRDVWGRGFASEAGRALLDWHFRGGGGPLASGIHPDNRRSLRVLERLGFVATGESATYFASRQAEIVRAMHRLDPEAWAGLRAASE